MKMKTALVGAAALAATLPGTASAAGAGEEALELGSRLPLWSVAPFVLLLLLIAVLPLLAGKWWESNLNKGLVAALCALPVLTGLPWAFADAGAFAALLNSAHEYYSFIVLLASLFIISGGIHLEGDLQATPRVNAAFLGVGAVLASFIGTTGAAMLLIRPLLKTNSERRHTKHVFIFFIFIVANAGGLLLPLGDPPLFLGFLRGVPFFWTLRLWPIWLFVVGGLLTIFYVWDKRAYSRETASDLERDRSQARPLQIRGAFNLLLLLGVLAAVMLLKDDAAGGVRLAWLREPAMILAAFVSLAKDRAAAGNFPEKETPREMNRFTFGPIIEVAVLFAGIFACMVPALAILRAKGAALGVDRAWEYFWMSGILSSFLDNAPTYLTFLTMAQGATHCTAEAVARGICLDLPTGPVEQLLLAAVSTGSVLMGANSYIGNGPNFMVKATADEGGVKMPGFFGYMVYSGLILLPMFVLVSLLLPILYGP